MPMKLFNNKIIITDNGELEFSNSFWRTCNLGAVELSPGISEVTLISPDRNTLGGYQLDASNEYLYFINNICNDWDIISDPKIFIRWECNVDNTEGNIEDVVVLELNCHIKKIGEDSIRFQSSEESIIIGQSTRYKQFETIFTLDFDDISNPINIDDLLSFRLRLNTNTSDVDNIIVNQISFRYKARKVDIEVE